MDEVLSYEDRQVTQITDEITQLNAEDLVPLNFTAMKSIESARTFLSSFFKVLLEMNVYKRELEKKCVEITEEKEDNQKHMETLKTQITQMQMASENRVAQQENKMLKSLVN